MTPEETQNMQNALRQNHDVFAWAHSNMKGIDPSITSHRLNVLPTARPIRQRVRRFHPDRQKIILNEVDKLLEVGFIREVDYPDWLANVVVVPKKEGKWRVCVDYTNLNNACPKTVSLCHKLWIPLLGKGCSLSWMPSPDTTKSPCPQLMKKKQPS